ncbi:aminotransferase class V-fold PLP-dependent enzyme [bacterium]|nr:aminotransferase class V-fold PLP-dependent enzyme [bacterium]
MRDAFFESHPDYRETDSLDRIREREFGRLDASKQIYLDFTGGGLYALSQVEAHKALLSEHVFGNPHSSNPSSKRITLLVEETRKKILKYFNAGEEEYVAVFTPNASGALKMVGEAYPFSGETAYLLTFDNHNSVNGIREFARSKGSEIVYVPITLPDLHPDRRILKEKLDSRPKGGGLFAFPAQSNFSGVQHDLEWIPYARERGWDVILDAAAFVPTNILDLSVWKPDFVPLSFYKMFGYPTGIGCLLARRDALKKLHRPWFAGGTITAASVQGDTYYLAEGAEGFEDGTLNYLSLPAVKIGLDFLESVDVRMIHRRVMELTDWLLVQLVSLKHDNGPPLLRIYGPLSVENRGAALTMNFFDPDGQFFDHRLIERAASRWNISLRTGCFCNPGGREIALELSESELITCFAHAKPRLTMEDFRHCVDGKSSGAVRISLGLASNFTDVYRFLCFARQFVNRTVSDFT